MKDLEKHPTVVKIREASGGEAREARLEVPQREAKVTAAWLRSLALELGADDAGVVHLDRPELDEQRADIIALFPRTRTLLSFVVRMNRENIRTPARSLANLEFHHATDEVNEIARHIVSACEERGIGALNGAAGFPMEADRWGTKMWVVSHKPVAVAAGLGQMGIHRNVIHPKFGNFISLGTVLLAAEVDEQAQAIAYNPCVECKLCVAACPTGAIGSDGYFNFSACYTHNYREFMGGFVDWAHTLTKVRDAAAYREKVSDAETVSMWQSLAFGPNYKAAYCMAVCPAGEDVIRPFLEQRKEFLDEVVRPLQEKKETVYVLAESDAEEYVARRYPNKRTKRVSNGTRMATIAQFLRGITLAFQPGRAKGLNAAYEFTFTGEEPGQASVLIRDQRIAVSSAGAGVGDEATARLKITADSATWLRFLAGEASIFWALVRRKIRLRGSPKLLLAFARCFAR
jgi:Fe-S-cluster-containing hydrogenase component 2